MNSFSKWLEQLGSNPDGLLFYGLLFLSVACFVQLGFQIARSSRTKELPLGALPFRPWLLPSLAKYPTFVFIYHLFLSFFLGIAFLVLALAFKGIL